MSTKRVCVIGAGPSGMSALKHYLKLGGDNKPEVVCYEKQTEWGGMWNYSWRTGTDEFGELCHNGMYRFLWINDPIECIEMPDYTLQEHFGKSLPSYVPRAVAKDYMKGLWDQTAKDTNINFNHVVKFVKYNQKTDDFYVIVSDLKSKTTKEEIFSHVIVAVGIFSTPNKPYFSGIERFEGNIIHSHDLRNPKEFRGQRILVIGGSVSAMDISVQLMKYGADSVLVSHRYDFTIVENWPDRIRECRIVKQINKDSVLFEDETSAEVDAIVLCTGYCNSFPFLEGQLQMSGKTSFFPDNLYKCVVWIEGGNNKLFYIGVQNPTYTLPLFDLQANYVWKFITGTFDGEPKSTSEMKTDIQKWVEKSNRAKEVEEFVELHAEYLQELNELTGSNHKILEIPDMLIDFVKKALTKIGIYRDNTYTSVYTGQKGRPIKPWMEIYDEDISI